VQGVKVNGKTQRTTSIDSSVLAHGGTIDFAMGPKPSTWGTGSNDAPPSLACDARMLKRFRGNQSKRSASIAWGARRARRPFANKNRRSARRALEGVDSFVRRNRIGNNFAAFAALPATLPAPPSTGERAAPASPPGRARPRSIHFWMETGISEHICHNTAVARAVAFTLPSPPPPTL